MTAFEEGVSSYQSGLELADNPYKSHDIENRIEWGYGWISAKDGDDCENWRGGDDSE